VKAYIYIILLSVILISGCGEGNDPPAVRREAGRSILTEDSGGRNKTTDEVLEDKIANTLFTGEKEIVPRVSINPPLSLLQVMDVNLDLDRHEEQLLAVKSDDTPDSVIKILVADYDTLRNGYVTTWEAPTGSTQRRFFSITLVDIIGDHNTEIVCSGIDSQGNQTIDMFRRSSGANRFGLTYETILSLQVPGTIEIRESERNQAYLNGLKNGESFPVLTTVEDENDLVSVMYAWRNAENSFIQVNEERTPRKEIEDRKLKDLFSGSVEKFEYFLSRSWNGGDAATLFFDRSNREITLYSGDIQEIYSWTSSYRFLSNSISIKGENELVPYMKVEISVRIQDNNTILVSLYDVDSQTGRKAVNDSWSGTYYSTANHAQGNAEASGSGITLPLLNGFYRGESGEELFLDPPRFTLSAEKEKLSGGFAVYMLNVPIFAMKIINEKGIAEGEKVYRLIYREDTDADKVTRNLILVPGRIGVRGLVETDGAELRFRQIEYFEQEQSAQ
jgi:hypothetical protein